MLEAAHRDLVESGVIEPVALGGDDEKTWLDCDLASLAENRIGDRHGPIGLTPARRAEWQSRVTLERSESLAVRGQWERCYWLLENGVRVGTVGLATEMLGGMLVRLSSLYVFPSHRGRGTGERAMRRLRAAFARYGLGIRLDTHWTWPAVRFYLRLGMWVYMWKRDLVFFWDAGTPDHHLLVEPEVMSHAGTSGAKVRDGEASRASLSVRVGEKEVVLARATRRGDRLEMDDRGELPEAQALDPGLGTAPWHACSTLCLAIALEGWPLVRSQEDWDRSYHMDGGSPEALGYKISVWEAWDRKAGFAVHTPRIPGLSYPTWDELEAQWAAEQAQFDAEMARAP